MSFSDSIPQPSPPEPEQRERPAWMRPDTVIPGAVPAELLLVGTDQVAAADYALLAAACDRLWLSSLDTQRSDPAAPALS